MRKFVFCFLAVIVGLVPLMAAGCSGGEKTITVGAKNFTEQYIIGQMMVQLLEKEGFTVEYAPDMATQLLRSSMEAGDIDICADYTGTGWMTHLGHEYTPGTDNNAVYQQVKDEDAGNGFTWLDPIWNNNTYVLVSWPEFVQENGLTNLSDLAALYNANKVQARMFVNFEFSTRPDGLPALEKHYGFTVPEEAQKTSGEGSSLLALQNHECEVAMAFGTDAAIAKNGWYVYQDDQAFWPPYDLTPYVRTEVLEKYPEVKDIINKLVATFPGGGQSATGESVAQGQQIWQGLNAKVDVDKMEPDEVARQYLLDKGLISE